MPMPMAPAHAGGAPMESKGKLTGTGVHLGMAQNETAGVTQVLVHVSTYRVPFWYPFFEPQPFGYGSK